MNLSDDHKKYIYRLWKEMREANLRTRRYNREWENLNEAINDKLKAEGITDIVQIAKIKNASIPLSDAFGAGKWWREKSVWLANAIQAEKAAMEMLTGER